MSQPVIIKTNNGNGFYTFFCLLMCVFTAVIGNKIRGSLFWSVVDFFFWPIAWAKWLICQEVSVSLIKSAFSSFLS
jgi:hypothetical protein